MAHKSGEEKCKIRLRNYCDFLLKKTIQTGLIHTFRPGSERLNIILQVIDRVCNERFTKRKSLFLFNEITGVFRTSLRRIQTDNANRYLKNNARI